MWPPDEVATLARDTFFGKPVVIEHLHGSLHGDLHLPPNLNEKQQACPAVLLLHGLGGNRHECGGLFIKAAATLARAGMVALRFDFRGAGETGGTSRDISLTSEIQDANDAFEHLLEYPFVDRKRIAVLGFSFGGLVAACLAGKREDIAALALWQAAYDMKSILKRTVGHISMKTVRQRGYLQAGGLQLDVRFFEALDEVDVGESIKLFTRPVLVVQGVADQIVLVDTAYQWKRGFKSTDVEVNLIQDADHAFTQDVWAWNAIERTASFLQQALGK